MEEAAKPEADQKWVFFSGVSEGQDQDPKGGAVGKIAMVVVPAVVDKVEPEHIDVRDDGADDDANDERFGRPKPANASRSNIACRQVANDHWSALWIFKTRHLSGL